MSFIKQKISQQKNLDDIFTFLSSRKKVIDILPCFQDIWLSLNSQDKKIIITNNILNWMNFPDKNYSKKQSSFVKFLKCNNISYTKEIDNYTERKNIIIDIFDFKKAIMKLNTKNSAEIREYYINIEELLSEFSKYKLNVLLTEKTAQYEREKRINKIMIFNQKKIYNFQKNDIIYIIATNTSKKQNIYKLSTTKIENKNDLFNTINDNILEKYEYLFEFKCYDSFYLENLISKLLESFKYIKNNKKFNNIFQINLNDLFSLLTIIINNVNNSFEYVNNNQEEIYKNYIEKYSLQIMNK